MPQMGYDMTEGTVVRWLKPEGAEVNVGEAIAEIETDKAVVEFESTAAGVLRKIVVSEGTTVPVGHTLALIGSADEELPNMAVEPPPTAEPQVVESVSVPPRPTQVVDPTATAQAVRASPVARRLAEERSVDLGQVKGTGPGGRITKDDVLAFQPTDHPQEAVAAPPGDMSPTVAAPPADMAPTIVAPPGDLAPAVAPGEKIPLTRMRQQIARVTVKSKQEIPHFYVSAEVDVTQAMATRRQINDGLVQQDVRVSVNDLVIKACVGALKRYPKFNASFDEDGVQMNEEINVGIAIAEEEGLTVPAIIDCGNKSLVEIAKASRDLIERSKSGTLRPQEYTGGTFSISNMGMFDVSSFVAIIHPPNSAVLAVGKVAKKPVVKDDRITVAEMMSTTLSVDHRVADGAEGAQFIVEVKRLLENPVTLVM